MSITRLLFAILAETFIIYAVAPFTLEIVWKWFVAGVLQGVVLGAVTHLVYKPAAGR